MEISESKYLEILKGQIVGVMQQSHPEIPDLISNWKGQNILDFQDDLRLKQNEYISEKMVLYTHENGEFKTPAD